MSKQKQGRQYENDLAKELHRNTEGRFVVRAGYSGNSALPLPDIYIRNCDETYDVAFEVKRTSRDHTYVDRDDFVNLYKLRNRVPYKLDTVFAYKFSQREMLTHSIPHKSKDSVDDVIERYVKEYDRVSRSGEDTVRIDKPALDDYPSARSGVEDYECLKACLPE